MCGRKEFDLAWVENNRQSPLFYVASAGNLAMEISNSRFTSEISGMRRHLSMPFGRAYRNC